MGSVKKAQSKDTAYPDMAALMDYTFPIAQKRHQELDRQNKKVDASKPVVKPKPTTMVTLVKSVEGTPYTRHRTLIFFSSVLGVCLLLALYKSRGAKRRRKRGRMERLQKSDRSHVVL